MIIQGGSVYPLPSFPQQWHLARLQHNITTRKLTLEQSTGPTQISSVLYALRCVCVWGVCLCECMCMGVSSRGCQEQLNLDRKGMWQNLLLSTNGALKEEPSMVPSYWVCSFPTTHPTLHFPVSYMVGCPIFGGACFLLSWVTASLWN